MNKRTVVLSTVVAAGALVGAIAPAAVASESAAAAGSLDCKTDYETDPGSIYFTCYNNGRYSAFAEFDAEAEPEVVYLVDSAQDGKAVHLYVRRASNGELFGKARNAGGGGTIKDIHVPEGTRYAVKICLDGSICSGSFTGRA